jgi:hypothetical protein
MFFFEKKNQKLLDFGAGDPATVHANEQKSFASFLQKRRPSLSGRHLPGHGTAGRLRSLDSSTASRDGHEDHRA